MSLANLGGLFGVLILIGPLVILVRRLQREIQAVFLLLTRRTDITIALFSILFFPGVLLHEISHFLTARLVGVRTGRFSVLPRPLPNGRLQLGFVETAPTDWFRDALIGAAPMIAGSVFIAFAGYHFLNPLETWAQVQAGNYPAAVQSLQNVFQVPDFWIWLYLVFTVSSTMLPSANDRHAWLPVFIILCCLLGVTLVAGGGPWLVEYVLVPVNSIMLILSAVLALSLVLHLVFLFPVWASRSLLSLLMHLEVH